MSKVLFVIGLNKNGGAEKRAKYIASLIKDEFESFVFAFVGNNDVDYSLAKTYQEYKGYSKTYRVKYLADIIKQIKPDVVFSFLPHINFFTTRAIKKSGLKNVKHVVSLAFYKFKLKDKFLLNYSIKRCSSVFYQCEEQKLFVKTKQLSFVISNPIDIPTFKEKETLKRFISVGRLEEQKDFSLMIDAFNEMSKQRDDITLDIFGNGSQKEMLNKKIEELHLTDKIHLFEYIDNINEEYQKHDAFLFTTKAEGFPNALAEAMANGLPCFSTYFHTGCDELLINNKTGFVCNSRDSKKLAEMICSTLKDEENVKTVAKNGYEHVKELCSSERIKQRIIEEINKLL